MIATSYDIIGDIHGCYDELCLLLARLGYKRTTKNAIAIECPPGRRLGFVGDFCDRGPDSARVLALVMNACRTGSAVAVPGNHCDKLRRLLLGNPVKAGEQLVRTHEQIKAYSGNFPTQALQFLSSLPVVFETDDLVLVHAAYLEGLSEEDRRNLALYGCSRGESSELGPWENRYAGKKTVVHGHEFVLEPSVTQGCNGGTIVNVDTGSCFGNKLTCLRFPEMEFVSVKAKKRYFKRRERAQKSVNL